MKLLGAINTNAATIILDGAASQLLKTSGGADALANFAANAAAGDFTIKNGRNFTTAGALSNAGTLTVGEGVGDTSVFRLGAGGTAKLTNTGTLAGSGIIQGNVENSGIIVPGNSPGLLTITGNYTQLSPAELAIQILNAGTYDQLSITGTAGLGGTLSVSLLPGAVINDGETFTVLHSSGLLSGEFEKYIFDIPQSLSFTTDYTTGHDVILTAHGSTVPLPPSLLLFGSGLVGMFGYRLHFKRRTAA
jgi:hypothetical protein